MPSTQAILSATQTPTCKVAPLTQSAACMVDNATYGTKFSQLDTLLDGGLKQGFILELSGPPGCIKETLAVNVVGSFVGASKQVLFVGKISPSSVILHHYHEPRHAEHDKPRYPRSSVA